MSKHDVFLSYNKADKPAVDEIARQLVKAGLQPWLDEWNLIPGDPWQEAIEKALVSCATCAVFVGPSGTGPWQNEEMRAAIQRRVSERSASKRPFRVIPVLLPGAERGERSQLPTFLVATTWVEFRQTLDDDHTFHRLVCGIRGIEPGPEPGQAIYEGQCPYRGLQFFDVQHAPFFFGREALTGWLLNELRPTMGKQDTRFLAIIGASGSGKSSLARAGLVAALKRGEIEHSEQWPIYIVRPGPAPLESLAVALSSNTTAALGLIKDLRDDERTLHLATRLMLRDATQELRVVVLVDQFEEVFTLCQDDGARQAFIDNLLYAANVVQGQTIVLLTLRADFYGKCALYPALAAAMSDHQVLVGQMTRDELRQAIERPAQLAGCEIEQGLTEILLRDVVDQPGSLPLLQHALLELWTRREGRRLTLETYQAIGRAEGALQQRAEAVYNGFSESEKEICRRIFLRLTQPGEGTEDTKRRATFQELLPAGEQERETVESVIQKLANEEARLVITEGGDTSEGLQFIEVAHEAIIQGWLRLREWIEEDRDSLRIHRRLTEDANEWKQHDKDGDYLYRGGRLAVVAEWSETHIDELNVLEREFLNASLERTRWEEYEIERRRQQELEAAQRLAESEGRRAETMELLREIGVRISAALTLEEILPLIVQGAIRLVGANTGAVFLLDKDGQNVTELFRYPSDVAFAAPRLSGGGLTHAIISSGEPISVPDIRGDYSTLMTPHRVWIDTDIKSTIGVPLKVIDKVIGVLYINSTQQHQFTNDEKSLLVVLADQAAIAVQNARLYEHISQNLERRIQELEVLTEIGRTINSTLDPTQVLELVYQQTFRIIDCTNVLFCIALYEKDKDQISLGLVMEQATGKTLYKMGQVEAYAQQWTPRMRRDPPGLIDYIIQTRKPLLITGDFISRIEDYGIDLHPTVDCFDLPVCSWLGVPMMVRDRVYGAIAVQSLEQAQAFDNNHLGLLAAIASQAGIAIENARLYQDARIEVIAAKQLSTLGTAVAVLQHRINNTFNIILPNVTRLRKRVDTTDQTIMEILDIIERNARYTSDAIHRIQEPLKTIESQNVNVNSILHESAIRARELQGTELVDVELKLNDPLPLIRASIGQLTEVFRNLIDNAYRAMPTGGHLTITSQLSDGMICVRVQDTGHGISPEIQEQLFSRPVPPKDPGQGSGLGLWLSHLMLQTMGGDIVVEKSAPFGTTMLVKLPVSSGEV